MRDGFLARCEAVKVHMDRYQGYFTLGAKG